MTVTINTSVSSQTQSHVTDIKQNNNGQACTCAVIEFHYRQSEDYTIQVEQFPSDGLQEQFKELLQTYRRYHSAEEHEITESEANVALHTFQAAFRNQALPWETYLLQADEQAILNNFVSWIADSTPKFGIEPILLHGEQQCSQRLEQLTSELPNSVAVWPYIKRVMYGLALEACLLPLTLRQRLLESGYLE